MSTAFQPNYAFEPSKEELMGPDSVQRGSFRRSNLNQSISLDGTAIDAALDELVASLQYASPQRQASILQSMDTQQVDNVLADLLKQNSIAEAEDEGEELQPSQSPALPEPEPSVLPDPTPTESPSKSELPPDDQDDSPPPPPASFPDPEPPEQAAPQEDVAEHEPPSEEGGEEEAESRAVSPSRGASSFRNLVPRLPSPEAEEPSLVEVGADDDEPRRPEEAPYQPPLNLGNEPSMVQVGEDFEDEEAEAGGEEEERGGLRAPVEDAPVASTSQPAEQAFSMEAVSAIATAASVAAASAAVAAARQADDMDRKNFMSEMLFSLEKKRERAATKIQAVARGFLIRQRIHRPKPQRSVGTTSQKDIDAVLSAILSEVADGKVSLSLEMVPGSNSVGRININQVAPPTPAPAPPVTAEMETQTRAPLGPPTTERPPYIPDLSPLPALDPLAAGEAPEGPDDEDYLSRTVPTATSSLITRAMETIRNIDARLQAEKEREELEEDERMDPTEIARLKEAAEAAARLLNNLEELQAKASPKGKGKSKGPAPAAANKSPVRGGAKGASRPPKMEQQVAMARDVPEPPPRAHAQPAELPPQQQALKDLQHKLTAPTPKVPPLSKLSPAKREAAASILEKSALAPRPGPSVDHRKELAPVQQPTAPRVGGQSESELNAETSWVSAVGDRTDGQPASEHTRLAMRHRNIMDEKRDRARKRMEAEQKRARELQAWLEQQDQQRKMLLEEREQERKRRLQDRMARFSQMHQERVEARARFKREQEEKKMREAEAKARGQLPYMYQRAEEEWKVREQMERQAEIERAIEDRRLEDIAKARLARKEAISETLTRAAMMDLQSKSVEKQLHQPSSYGGSSGVADDYGVQPLYDPYGDEKEPTPSPSHRSVHSHHFGEPIAVPSTSYDDLDTYSSPPVQLTPQPVRAAILDYVDDDHPPLQTHPQRKPRVYSALDPPKRKQQVPAAPKPVVGGWVENGSPDRISPHRYNADRQLAAARASYASQVNARKNAVLNQYAGVVQEAMRPLREEHSTRQQEMLERKRKQVAEAGLRAQRDPVDRQRVNLREVAGLGVGGAGLQRRR